MVEEENIDEDEEEDEDEDESEEEDVEEKKAEDYPPGGLRFERSERLTKEVSKEPTSGKTVRSSLGKKQPRKTPIIDHKRIADEFLVKIPKLVPLSEGWLRVLLNEEDKLEEDLFEEVSISSDMRSGNAIYMIAYFCSIMNTDPSYVDPFFCWEEGFEMKRRPSSNLGDPNEIQYNEFRTVFGVVIAYIAGFLMHYHIEISLAMYKDDEGGHQFVDHGKFIFWDDNRKKILPARPVTNRITTRTS